MSDEVQAEVVAEETEDTTPRTAKKVSGIEKDAALTVLKDTNPKRVGSASYDRFDGYLTDPVPTTVQDALDKGLTMGDIKYDIIHEFIEVDGAEVEEYEVNPRGPRGSKSKDEDSAEVDNDLLETEETEEAEAVFG